MADLVATLERGHAASARKAPPVLRLTQLITKKAK
jgi:hypothetical protein